MEKELGYEMKKNKKIYCEKCCGEIINKDELVVTKYCLSIVPYHEACFAKELKGISTMVIGNSPINGTMSNIAIVLMVIIGISVLFIPEIRYISLMALLILYIRFYSWFKYERHLQ